MNLNFMKKWPWGKETDFRYKVIKSVFAIDPTYNYSHLDLVGQTYAIGKCHTIRKGDRWKPGMKIHFRQWSGLPYKSEAPLFAPVVPCISVQKISIKYTKKDFVRIKIDGKLFHEQNIHDTPTGTKSFDKFIGLCLADGFDLYEGHLNFFKYFNKDFKGQIIHWTNLRYNG